MKQKEINSKLSYTMLVFLVGLIILYPSFAAILVKPNSAEWLFSFFIVLAIIGICCGFLGFYLNEFTRKTDDKIVGIGSWTSILAFFLFVIYFLINLYQDKTEKLSIETIKYSPVNVHRGENIKITTTLNNMNNEDVHYTWITDRAIINLRPNSKIDFLHIPINYSKDSIKVNLTIQTGELKLKDSILIYLKNDEKK
jgi:Tfp pilus assembly major pilin PilA